MLYRILAFFAAVTVTFVAGCSTEDNATMPSAHNSDMSGGLLAEGACCLADGSCIVISSAECAELGGTYQGDDTPCDPNPCTPPPA